MPSWWRSLALTLPAAGGSEAQRGSEARSPSAQPHGVGVCSLSRFSSASCPGVPSFFSHLLHLTLPTRPRTCRNAVMRPRDGTCLPMFCRALPAFSLCLPSRLLLSDTFPSASVTPPDMEHVRSPLPLACLLLVVLPLALSPGLRLEVILNSSLLFPYFIPLGKKYISSSFLCSQKLL